MAVTVYDFYADWCGPCDQQDPIIEELRQEMGDEVVIKKVDIDEDQETANAYNVRSIPTVVVENDDHVVENFTGVTQIEEIKNAIEVAKGGD